jgi:hypothetical protein
VSKRCLRHPAARRDKMLELVDRMLELSKQKHSGRLAPSQVKRVDREIAASSTGPQTEFCQISYR